MFAIRMALILVPAFAMADDCEPYHRLGVWQPLGDRDIREVAQRYKNGGHQISEVLNHLGRPVRTEVAADGSRVLHWRYGSQRETHASECGEEVEVTYTTVYTMARITFYNDGIANCHVREAAFVSSKKRPDPFFDRGGLMSLSLISCDDFVKLYGHE